MFLKAKVKELQVKKEDDGPAKKDGPQSEVKKDINKENVYGDEFELIPVGKIEQINKKEMIQHRIDLNEDQPQKRFNDPERRPPYENKPSFQQNDRPPFNNDRPPFNRDNNAMGGSYRGRGEGRGNFRGGSGFQSNGF